MQQAYEVNFDGLIGNTHNYAGLSRGNLASTNNALQVSHPRLAARQGLAKMQVLHKLGLKQGIFLPQERPHLPTLRHMGFFGSDKSIIEKVSRSAPELLSMCYSASSMWAANAATVSPSSDTADSRIHFTPANLKSMLHRSIECDATAEMLKHIFNSEEHFQHHKAFSGGVFLGDEGAANHHRLCADYGERGVELFVYGCRNFDFECFSKRSRYPARQSFEASSAIARRHKLLPEKVIMAQLNPGAINAGAFHADVVSVTNKNLLFCHEHAFLNKDALYKSLESQQMHIIEVPNNRVSLEAAIRSYLFNSLLVSLPGDKGMTLVLPKESQEDKSVLTYLVDLIEQDTPIKNLEFVDVRQSMRNGGGPACLRLRVVLTELELQHVNRSFMFSEQLYERLNQWVDTHYRDELSPCDFSDPELLRESHTALDELTQILGLGSYYRFQQ